DTRNAESNRTPRSWRAIHRRDCSSHGSVGGRSEVTTTPRTKETTPEVGELCGVYADLRNPGVAKRPYRESNLLPSTCLAAHVTRAGESMKEKVVLITGAKGGLGSFITRRFLETGATVVGASRSISQQDFAGRNFTALAVDFTKAVAVNDAVQLVITRFGRLDVLVHLLGGFAGGQTVAETDDATWERMRDLNLT